MNKLKELHKKAIDSSYYSEVYANIDSVIEFSEQTAIDKATEITTDVAVKFAEWLETEVCNDIIHDSMIVGEPFDKPTLFETFMAKYYKQK